MWKCVKSLMNPSTTTQNLQDDFIFSNSMSSLNIWMASLLLHLLLHLLLCQCFPFQHPLISAIAFVTMETGLAAASLAGLLCFFFSYFFSFPQYCRLPWLQQVSEPAERKISLRDTKKPPQSVCLTVCLSPHHHHHHLTSASPLLLLLLPHSSLYEII